jgi:hypothetical protein
VQNFEELPREEALIRLYQLKNQLDMCDVIALEELKTLGPGFCDDCHAASAELRSYGRTAGCERCILGRMSVKRYSEAHELGLG